MPQKFMSTQMTFALAYALALVTAFACADERPQPPAQTALAGEKYSGNSSVADPTVDNSRDAFDSDGQGTIKNSVAFFKNITQDASDFTFGIAAISLQTEIGSGAIIDRMLYLSKPSSLTAAEKQALLPLCRDFSLESGAETVLAWRSHYPLALKKLMASLFTKGQSAIFCVLRISENRGTRYLAFEPNPTDQGMVQGTSKGDHAVSQGLMVPVASTLSIDQSNLILVTSTASVSSAVKALNHDSISLQTQDDITIPCWYDSTQPGSVIGNPTNPKKISQVVKSQQSAKVLGFVAKPIAGRIIKNCEKVELTSTPDSIQTQLSCQNYQDIKNEGLEAGCQWDLEFANTADPLNTVSVPLKLPVLNFKTIDLKKSDDVLSLLPRHPYNPVRSKSSVFSNFNESQLKYAELAFDIWLGVYPKSFNDDYKDFVKTVTLSDSCDPGVGGFARLNSTAFTWCSPNLVVTANNPSRPVFHAILIAHETRHARGWNHDIDDPKYTPCQGSAASAAVMHAIVATCKEDYCAVLRNAAVNEYITELNYSLKGDARRFQGQCKDWSNAMGLTDASLTGAK